MSAQCQWIMFSWKVPPTTNSPGPIIMVTTTTIVKEVGRQFAFVGGSAACRESSSPWTCSSSSAGRSQFWVVPIQSKGCRPLRCCNSRPPAAAILRVRAGCSPRARQWLCRSGTCWRPHRCDRGLLATVDSCPPPCRPAASPPSSGPAPSTWRLAAPAARPPQATGGAKHLQLPPRRRTAPDWKMVWH